MNDKVRGAMAAIQALNGMAALYKSSSILARSEGFSGTQIVLLATIALSLVGILAGFYLWRGHSFGLWLTAGFQIPQLVKIKSDLLIYQVELGTGLDLLLIKKMGLAVTWGFRTNFYLWKPVPELQITVNLIALIFLYLVYREMNKNTSER